jgi:2-C-methyl-D-erythritol 4-phosphate cytidylyltransferase/2-C-methyl-D-erythritol 2,4-cyclodiphosphate synthase
MTRKTSALIVAAGRGTRLADPQDRCPKQYLTLDGKPMLAWTLEAILQTPHVADALVVIHADDGGLYEASLAAVQPAMRERILPPAFGGATRQASVHAGLEALASRPADQTCAHVLVHDAARPFLMAITLDRMTAALQAGEQAVLAALPVHDTLKRAGPDGYASGTVDRSGLWAAQTPQGFAFEPLIGAHRKAANQGHNHFTDDTSLAEWAGMRVQLVEGAAETFKVTTRADLERARAMAVLMRRPANT